MCVCIMDKESGSGSNSMGSNPTSITDRPSDLDTGDCLNLSSYLENGTIRVPNSESCNEHGRNQSWKALSRTSGTDTQPMETMCSHINVITIEIRRQLAFFGVAPLSWQADGRPGCPIAAHTFPPPSAAICLLVRAEELVQSWAS